MKKTNFFKKRLLMGLLLFLVSAPFWAQPAYDISWDGTQYVIRVSGTGIVYPAISEDGGDGGRIREVYDYFNPTDSSIPQAVRDELRFAPKSFIIEEGITDICNSAFGQIYNVQSISLPSSVEFIGSGAFRAVGYGDFDGDGLYGNASGERFLSLTSITVNRYLPPMGVGRPSSNAFDNGNYFAYDFDKSAVTIYIPEGVDKNLFIRDAAQWEGFTYVNKPMTGTTGSPVMPTWEMFMYVPGTVCEGDISHKIKLSDVNSIQFSQTGDREMTITTNNEVLEYVPVNELEDPFRGSNYESPYFCKVLPNAIYFGLRNTNTEIPANVPDAPVADDNQVIIYPNPATDVLFAEGETLDNITLVAVYAMDGRTLVCPYTKQSGKIQINTQNLVRGMYLLQLNNQSYKFQKR